MENKQNSRFSQIQLDKFQKRAFSPKDYLFLCAPHAALGVQN